MNLIQSLLKKTIVTFSSVMLLNLSFVYNVDGLRLNFSSNTFAQETTTTTYGATSTGQTGTAKLKGDGTNFLTGPDLALLVYIAAAFVVYKLSASCKSIAPDAWAAIAGVGIFLAGELMEMFSSTQKLKSKKIEYKTRGEDGKIDDEQYQALVAEKSAMDTIADSASKRAKFQNASAVAFAAAAGIAYYNRAAELGMEVKCLEGSQRSGEAHTLMAAKYNASAATAAATPGGAGAAANFTALAIVEEEKAVSCKAAFGAVTKKDFPDDIPEGSLVKCGAKSSSLSLAMGLVKACPGSVGPCTQEVNQEKQSIMCCTVLDKVTKSSNKNFTPRSFNIVTLLDYLLINEARAVDGLIGGILGSILGYIFVESEKMNILITSPGTRAKLWGGLSAFGMLVANGTKKTAENAKKNSEILDKIIKKFEKSKRGLTVIARNGNSPVQMGGMINLGGGDQAMALGDQLPCSAGLPQTTGSSVTCPASPFLTNTAFRNGTNFPTGLNPTLTALSNFTKETEGQRSLSTKAQGAVDTINANQNAVENFLKKSKDNLNKIRLAIKKPALDFAKEENALMSKLSNAARSQLQKSNETPASLFSKIGMRANSLASDEKKTDSKGKKDVSAVVDQNSGQGLQTAPGVNDNQFKFDFPDGQMSEDQFLANKDAEFKANEQAAAQNGGINGSDINKNKDESLFKVISGRYIKSGFKRLLDEL